MGERHHQQQQQQQQLHKDPAAARDIDLDDSMEDEDEDDDTVVGTCLHCSAPPPPRSSSRVSGSSSNPCGSGSGGRPCSNASTAAMTSSFAASCPPPATRVQVSCDDCRSFICDGCHWCHEFQANHEIRVCDRCDAFYCRGCDEMDQCEDCSEVVCNTCSTLMSCKFCGCGLCEDCATACGRCGIVLCARDAKFAVECDTCRMSYCLVCLASGTKDPCVRCGHRPTKRVEQLVHLRLKSIYKAFKQSGASMGPGPGVVAGSAGESGSFGCGRTDGKDISTMGGKYSAALRSLLTENGPDSSRDSFTNFDQSMASEVAAVLQTASHSMANSNGGDHGDGSRRSRGKRVSAQDHSPSPGGTQNRPSTRVSNAAAERYFRRTQAEMEAAAAAAEAEAEAAAAALLAELDEEKASSNAANSKKSKKKKKKKEKLKEVATSEQIVVNSSTTTDNVKSAEQIEEFGSSASQKKKSSNKTTPPQKSSKSSPPVEDDSSDEEMNFEQLVGRAKSGAKSSKKEKKDDSGEEKIIPSPSELKPTSPPPVDASAPTSAAITADFDAELAVLLSNDDVVGLESFLADLKGIPGLAAARKTAKKALKKIKETKDAVEPETPQTNESTISNVTAPIAESESKTSNLAAKATTSNYVSRSLPILTDTTTSVAIASNPTQLTSAQHEPLLRVVSRTLSNVGTSSARGSASNVAAPSASARAECVMHISPAVVGWVIGKGGSRIRDMMEESGAKIWIDQASMAAKESRVVYVSGKRSSVDTAVRMVKDLVSKAPVAVPTAAAKSSPASDESLEPTSFSAITSSTSAPVAAPAPIPSATTKQAPSSTQGWALPASGVSVSASVVPPAQVASLNNIVNVAPKPTVRSAVDVKGAAHLPPTVTSELDCDPRFVALLIGRRGWTVKNIQAESGATLRIDQAVDPPKIIMSGSTENVKKADQMVRDVLKYPHSLLNLENVPQANKDMLVNSTNRVEQQENVGDSQMIQMPAIPLTATQHDVAAAPTQPLLEVPLHQEPSHQTIQDIPSEGAMNFPPAFAQFQSASNSLSSFQKPSSAPMHPLFLPNDHHQTIPTPFVNFVKLDQGVRTQRQEWGDHSPSLPVQNQFSTLPPFSSVQVGTRDPYNMMSNLNSSLHQHPPQDNQRQSTFALLPDQRANFPSAIIHDIMDPGDMSHNVKGWDMPANSIPLGSTWNQSHRSSAQSNQHESAFQAQATRHITDNPFQQTQHHRQTYNNPVSDDSLMVDNMFASLVSSENDGNGLLIGLNSVSLGGGASHQGDNWGSKITDWTGDDTNSTLPHSRLGDYREDG
ncbi:hypothetical protein ACHAXH_008308 [Discostella pseudostelligera]